MRPRGVVVVEPDKPLAKGLLAEEAKQLLKAKQVKVQEAAAKRKATPIPNRVAYAWLYERWKANGGGPIPTCKRCDALLHWEEHHDCPGFKPKYVEHDDAWHERQEARREEIRASKTKIITCDGCGAELPTLEDAQWHEQYCVTDEVRAERLENRLQARYAHHNAVNGDEDDLSGYEDEPEEDYCEGDDDGYDCD
jgi:hypothetical protein